VVQGWNSIDFLKEGSVREMFSWRACEPPPAGPCLLDALALARYSLAWRFDVVITARVSKVIGGRSLGACLGSNANRGGGFLKGAGSLAPRLMGIEAGGFPGGPGSAHAARTQSLAGATSLTGHRPPATLISPLPLNPPP
jgi:hypothetical protein